MLKSQHAHAVIDSKHCLLILKQRTLSLIDDFNDFSIQTTTNFVFSIIFDIPIILKWCEELCKSICRKWSSSQFYANILSHISIVKQGQIQEGCLLKHVCVCVYETINVWIYHNKQCDFAQIYYSIIGLSKTIFIFIFSNFILLGMGCS